MCWPLDVEASVRGILFDPLEFPPALSSDSICAKSSCLLSSRRRFVELLFSIQFILPSVGLPRLVRDFPFCSASTGIAGFVFHGTFAPSSKRPNGDCEGALEFPLAGSY